ncbi:MAG: hypothetical protein ACK4NC_05600 [Candidatus Gracilibacteria bacterium]
MPSKILNVFRKLEKESGHPKEWLELDKETLKNLEYIKTLNLLGKHAIIAPNHIMPDSKMRQQFALADDFPALQKLLKSYGIQKNRPVARGDMDLEIGESKIKYLAYKTHQKVFSLLAKKAVNALPVNINVHEPQLIRKENKDNIQDIIDVLSPDSENTQKTDNTNVTMYPYGNWYEKNSQEFTDEHIIPKHAQHKSSKDKDAFEIWRNSLKVGVFQIAALTSSPIIPCYVSKQDDKWKLMIGEPIIVKKTADQNPYEASMKEYIKAMQDLKIKSTNSSH